jgi:hypothetical protein
MKKIKYITILAITLCSYSHAAYNIYVPLEKTSINHTDYNSYDSLYGNWYNTSNIYNCKTWNPDVNTITVGQNFKQQSSDCDVDQSRTVQKREIDRVSGTIRNIGSEFIESRINGNQINLRDAVGTLESWFLITPIYTDWMNSGNIDNCTNWSPLENTITINEVFTQTATDCQQPQTRTRQDREQEMTTGNIRNIGSVINESHTIEASLTRPAIGKKETWIDTTTIYGDWTNSGAVYGCTNWSPAASTVNVGTNVVQTATDCKQDQSMSVQAKEIETTTGVVRNKGTLTYQTKVITVSSTQTVPGTKTGPECRDYSASNHFFVDPLPQLMIRWDNVLIYQVVGSRPEQYNSLNSISTITKDGRTYTRYGSRGVCRS